VRTTGFSQQNLVFDEAASPQPVETPSKTCKNSPKPMPPWWKDMDFKKKNRVPREKSGRHSNHLLLSTPKKIRDGIQ
jgi:hypothetical protein